MLKNKSLILRIFQEEKASFPEHKQQLIRLYISILDKKPKYYYFKKRHTIHLTYCIYI